jgi:predicted SnoaL-like aldol condensation-catalyzing enzyme
MKIVFYLTFLCLFVSRSTAQQANMVKSSDTELAKNKKLVYDFWRVVFEGGHLNEASNYMTESYIQHNPNVPTGRKAFVDFFSKFAVAKPVVDTIQAALIAIVAEKDLVTLVFRQQHPDPKDPSQKYTTTWFDMFRIENGKIAEHWDPALKQ